MSLVRFGFHGPRIEPQEGEHDPVPVPIVKSFTIQEITLMKGKQLVWWLCALAVASFSTASAKWGALDGPYGGPFFALAHARDTVFACTNHGTVYRLTANDRAWVQFNIDSANSAIFALAVVGSDLFAGPYGYPGGVFRSQDYGATWQSASAGIEGRFILSFSVVGSEIYAGSENGRLFRSTDLGVTWADISIPGIASTVRALRTLRSSLLAGTSGDGVFRSTDNGLNWTAVNEGLTSLRVRALLVADTVVFAGTFGGGVFRSTNGGALWEVASQGLTSHGLGVTALASIQSQLFAGTIDGVFTSTNGGSSWTASNTGVGHSLINAIIAVDSVLYAATGGGGIFRSTDKGLTWEDASRGLVEVSLTTIFADGRYIFAGSLGGIYRSPDNGTTWNSANGGLALTEVQGFGRCGDYLLAGPTSGVLRSSDRGDTWTHVSAGLPAGSPLKTFASRDPVVLASTDYGVYRSTDRGESWSSVDLGFLAWGILALVTFGDDFLAGCNNGIYRSTDDGLSWAPLTQSNGPKNIWSLVAVDSILVASGSPGGLYVSTNGGTEWLLRDSTMYAGALETTGGRIFAQADTGVYASTDMGTSWVSLREDLPPLYAGVMAVNDSFVFAGTYGRIWCRSAADLAADASPWAMQNSPGAYVLEQNYPNPFNPATRIVFFLPHSSVVTLKVYDVLGREVAILVEERREAGRHAVDFDASGLASGLYLYRLQVRPEEGKTREYVATRRMSLVK